VSAPVMGLRDGSTHRAPLADAIGSHRRGEVLVCRPGVPSVGASFKLSGVVAEEP
jgi:hypothetical protein